jgi:hypothetical protein
MTKSNSINRRHRPRLGVLLCDILMVAAVTEPPHWHRESAGSAAPTATIMQTLADIYSKKIGSKAFCSAAPSHVSAAAVVYDKRDATGGLLRRCWIASCVPALFVCQLLMMMNGASAWKPKIPKHRGLPNMSFEPRKRRPWRSARNCAE